MAGHPCCREPRPRQLGPVPGFAENCTKSGHFAGRGPGPASSSIRWPRRCCLVPAQDPCRLRGSIPNRVTASDRGGPGRPPASPPGRSTGHQAIKLLGRPTLCPIIFFIAPCAPKVCSLSLLPVPHQCSLPIIGCIAVLSPYHGLYIRH